jgi:hypothetical protein
LLLASLGVYGVLAFSIARRTRELGIRMALARRPPRPVPPRHRGGDGARGDRARARVNPREIATFAIVPCILAAVALLACYLPARRAMNVDPIVALRES